MESWEKNISYFLMEIAESVISGFSGSWKETGKISLCLLHYSQNSGSSFFLKED